MRSCAHHGKACSGARPLPPHRLAEPVQPRRAPSSGDDHVTGFLDQVLALHHAAEIGFVQTGSGDRLDGPLQFEKGESLWQNLENDRPVLDFGAEPGRGGGEDPPVVPLHRYPGGERRGRFSGITRRLCHQPRLIEQLIAGEDELLVPGQASLAETHLDPLPPLGHALGPQGEAGGKACGESPPFGAALILPGKIPVPVLPRRPRQRPALAGQGQIGDGNGARPCRPVAVGKCVELLDIAEGMAGLRLDPGPQPRLQGAVPGLERARGQTRPLASGEDARRVIGDRDDHGDQFHPHRLTAIAGRGGGIYNGNVLLHRNIGLRRERMDRRKDLASWAAAKAAGEKRVLITAYDHPSARLAQAAGLDGILVGDSLGMVVQGRPDTLGVSLETMVYHTEMVARGAPECLIVADLPFGAFEASPAAAFTAAAALLKAGADAVKLEGGLPMAETVRFLSERGVPVIGHIGLTPQHIRQLGGFRRQGKGAEEAARLAREAAMLTERGARMILFEAVPAELAARLTADLPVPTIGIGAGAGTDAQILVWHDVLGLTPHPPPFARAYCDGAGLIIEALGRFAADVREKRFPPA